MYPDALGSTCGTVGTDTLCAEGDVEGVMDRPIGNTQEVIGECEKWYVRSKQAREPIISNLN